MTFVSGVSDRPVSFKARHQVNDLLVLKDRRVQFYEFLEELWRFAHSVIQLQ
jgi:nuclear transport factor 2 (NTF2) superfamily protein